MQRRQRAGWVGYSDPSGSLRVTSASFRIGHRMDRSNPQHGDGPIGNDDTTVVLVEWPRETEVAERLRLARRPRLLLLSPDAVPPLSADELQDWVRVPSDPIEVRARVKALELRAQRLRTPTLDENGRVTVGDKWVALPPIEARLMQAFVDAFATMVPRTELAQRAWPNGDGTPNQLDVRLRSLRRRLRPLGLQITAVRSRGFTLQWAR